ncbi:MAG: c-type cytochrome [Gammaproteobacteria bacterium]|nr:c-type cytochrome [Gammaproteobacteria bacterium]
MAIVVAGAAIVEYSPGANAQAVGAAADKKDGLRAVQATAVEVAEGKRIAQATCVRCHGLDGISTAKGVPHLAGQRPAYLYLELRAYQSGARGKKVMDGAVEFLGDDALVKVAAYYASLDPAPPVAASGAKAAPAKPDPVRAGKAAAAACAGCHGEGGISKTPGMPNLVALDPKYLVAAMKSYKSGQRKHDLMKSMLAAVSDADMNNVALYYALQTPARAQTPAAGNRSAGKTAAAACAGCHGNQGVSTNPAAPSLAGQDAQYLATALQAYKNGSRSDATMKSLAAALDDRVTKDMAAFYAAQPPQPPDVRKPLTTAEWVQKCDRCHGVNGNSTDPFLPALAGQRAEYMVKVLHDYRTRVHQSSTMAAMSDALTEADIENLAAYYARQKARAVVFMPVPGQ